MDAFNILYNECMTGKFQPGELFDLIDIVKAYEGPKLVVNKGKTNVKKILGSK